MHTEEKVIFKNSRKFYGVQFIHLYPTLGLHSVALGESSSLPRSDLFQMTGSRALACNVLMCLQLPEELVSVSPNLALVGKSATAQISGWEKQQRDKGPGDALAKNLDRGTRDYLRS